MIKEINLDNYSLIDTKSASSKGNQQKWLVNDLWYKADHMGYEGLTVVIQKTFAKKMKALSRLSICQSNGLRHQWRKIF